MATQERADNELVPAGVFGQSSARREESGRFMIEARPSLTMLPPVGDEVAALPPFAEADALIDSLVEPLELPLRSLPPPVPQTRSGIVPKPDPLEAMKPALEPYYRGLPISDRVELRIEDLSLDFDNPYAPSSLVPPPPRAFAWQRWLWVTCGGVAVIAAGVAFAMRSSAPERVSQPAAVKVRPSPVVVSRQARASVIVSKPSAPALPVGVSEAPPAAPPAAMAAPVENTIPATKTVATASAAIAASANKPSAIPAALPSDRVVAAPKPVEARTEVAAPTQAAGLFADDEDTSAVASAATAADVTSAAPEAAAEATLPETPTREDIMAGFEGVRAEVTTCAAGGHGTSVASVTISGSGRVTYAMIGGAFAGTPEGSCMARTLRTAHFPRFASPTLKVSYPFAL